MTDTWVPGPPPVPTPPIAPLPGANSWNSVEGCSVGPNQPSITNGVIITGVPATIVAPKAWGITLNDGSGPPNFTIDHYDNAGALIDHPMEISGANGSVTFNTLVYADANLTATNLQVSPGNLIVPDETHFQLGGGAAGWYLSTNGIGALQWLPLPLAADAPSDGTLYGRQGGGWTQVSAQFVPITGGVFTGNVTFAGTALVTGLGLQMVGNSALNVPQVSQFQLGGGSMGWYLQTNGTGSLTWAPPNWVPVSGGMFTGPVTFNGVVTLPANNSVVLNGAAGSQRSMLIGSAGSWRWQWLFADGTAETGSNTGSNFSLNAMSDTGAILSTPLAINRATGAVTIAGATGTSPTAPTLILNKGTAAPQGDLIQGQRNGLMRWQLNLANFSAELGGNLGSNFSIDRFDDTGAQLGVSPLLIARNSGLATFGYGVTVTGVLTLAAPTNLRIGGGSADQVLTTDGAGNLSWSTVTGGGAGGVGEAPEDGNLYGRTDGGWASGGTFADAVTIAQISPSLNLNKQTGTGGNQYASIYGQMLGSNRWELCLGGAVAESGTSAGSDFILYRYDNTGAYIDIPFQVTRATGVSTFSQLPSLPGGASGQALTTNGAGVLSWAGPYYAASNPSGYQTAAQVAAVLPPASTTLPLPSGVAAVGVGTTWARADHVHPLPPQAMNDNRIINGDMRIDQRNAGAVFAFVPGSYTVDRWQYNGTQTNQISGGQNVNSVVGPVGFPYYLGSVSQSAHAVLAADFFQIYQSIEADMISDFAWGTASAQPVTLSFWARSSLTGTFSGVLGNYAGTRSYAFSYSLPTANTWTKIVLNIPGDTAGAWVMSGNGGSLSVHFDLGSGATFRIAAGAWTAGNYVGANGAVSVVATNNAQLYLTGVKLEIGSVATPFNRQSPAKSMADCQRHYQKAQVAFSGYGIANLAVYSSTSFPQMRAAPTVTLTANNSSNFTLTSVAPSAFTVSMLGDVVATAGYTINFNFDMDAEL